MGFASMHVRVAFAQAYSACHKLASRESFGKQWPQFTVNGFYQGPLAQCLHQSHEFLSGLEDTGMCQTPSTSYPADLCVYLTMLVLSVLPVPACTPGEESRDSLEESRDSLRHVEQDVSKTGGGAGEKACEASRSELIDMSRDDERAHQVIESDVETAADWTHSTCTGQPITCRLEGRSKAFVDGFGICSPGRWRPEQRAETLHGDVLEYTLQINQLLRKFVHEQLGDVRIKAMELAVGRIRDSPFEPHAMEELRWKIARLTSDDKQLLEVPERQPFYLHLLGASLRKMKDPDWAILTQGEECFVRGVPVGRDHPIARAPEVFSTERKIQEAGRVNLQPRDGKLFIGRVKPPAARAKVS